jgi:Rod binding domain-containing protein
MDSAFLPMPSSHSVRSNPIGINPGGRALTQHEKLVEQTRKWVAVSFFEPMLKQMRQSPFHSKLLDGGEGGQAFESMYDERLAERMASDATDTLVSSIVRKIEGSKAYARQSADRVRAISATGDANVSSHF